MTSAPEKHDDRGPASGGLVDQATFLREQLRRLQDQIAIVHVVNPVNAVIVAAVMWGTLDQRA
ncbi:MAG: hypothetical protein FJX65_02480 [Alphaproteobacteria bacterium]|nr:hypothetical protein [Alphaproteobacteria bacterium]